MTSWLTPTVPTNVSRAPASLAKNPPRTLPFAVSHKLGYTPLRWYFPVHLHGIHTHAAFHPLYILVLTERPQDFPDFLSDLFEERLSTIFRDESDRITAIPAGVG